jgi:hypothetical protein
MQLHASLRLILCACCLPMDEATCSNSPRAFAPAGCLWKQLRAPRLLPCSWIQFCAPRLLPCPLRLLEHARIRQRGPPSPAHETLIHTHLLRLLMKHLSIKHLLRAYYRVRFVCPSMQEGTPEGTTFARTLLLRLLMKHLQHKAFAATYV